MIVKLCPKQEWQDSSEARSAQYLLDVDEISCIECFRLNEGCGFIERNYDAIIMQDCKTGSLVRHPEASARRQIIR